MNYMALKNSSVDLPTNQGEWLKSTKTEQMT